MFLQPQHSNPGDREQRSTLLQGPLHTRVNHHVQSRRHRISGRSCKDFRTTDGGPKPREYAFCLWKSLVGHHFSSTPTAARMDWFRNLALIKTLFLGPGIHAVLYKLALALCKSFPLTSKHSLIFPRATLITSASSMVVGIWTSFSNFPWIEFSTNSLSTLLSVFSLRSCEIPGSCLEGSLSHQPVREHFPESLWTDIRRNSLVGVFVHW